jgi:CRP/FNR family cyclic AMP-dependent transcriptional regulator
VEWPLLASLPAEDRARLLASTRRHEHARGDVVVHEGEPADGLYLVESGHLAVRVTTPEGDLVTLNVLGPGSYVGELSLLPGRAPTRTATVVALEAGATRSLSAAGFAALRRQYPDADRLLLTLLADRVEELSARLLQATHEPLEQRVCRRLLELAEAYADAPGPVRVPLTQDLLAELVGGTRPSVNHALRGLAARGVVELGRGRVTVLDRSWLAARVS